MEVLYSRCAGLDVHKNTVVACVRVAVEGKVHREMRTFDTTTTGLLALSSWLTESGCSHVAMEATGQLPGLVRAHHHTSEDTDKHRRPGGG